MKITYEEKSYERFRRAAHDGGSLCMTPPVGQCEGSQKRDEVQTRLSSGPHKNIQARKGMGAITQDGGRSRHDIYGPGDPQTGGGALGVTGLEPAKAAPLRSAFPVQQARDLRACKDGAGSGYTPR
jgi:hypothetical protein